MKITKQSYQQLANSKTPPVNHAKNIILAFIVGGIICTIGQLILNLFISLGQDRQNSATITSMALILVGGLLTGFRFYKKIAKHAGAGITVPITGFANSVVSSASEFKSEGYILGMGAKLFTIAGPVIAFGIIASILYGLIIYLFGLY